MLNRLSDLVRLRTFANTQVQSVSRLNVAGVSDLLPGEVVRAKVEAALPDGSFKVAIRNQPYLLRLPFQAKAGDLLQLSVVTREPQLKFVLVMQENTPALATSLSETARFITALLGESEKLPHAEIVHPGAPLLAGMPASSAQAAEVLRNALAHSGIFYEAHQAQWVAGERTLAMLMQEPQARFAPLRHFEESAPPERAGADGAESTPRLPELPVHRDALTMIKQQLDTLESRHVAWHGLIWHGQPLDWEITEEPPPAREIMDEPAWRTQLRLTLPRLGRIAVSLQFATRGVTIAVRAAAADTLSALEQDSATLRQSLRNAGITPLAIAVHHDESA